jgi:hypothetical protein
MPDDLTAAAASPTSWHSPTRLLKWLLIAASAPLYALHYLHLNADFPNNSPWVDWSKYTDEGWYGDAAIRHHLFGHWNFPGDFNPAAALPIWPLIEAPFFHLFGVSPAVARALTLAVFAITLVTLYRLIARHTRPHSTQSGPPLAAPIAIFLLCANPMLYVFERMAILEPLLICLTLLALVTASHLHPIHRGSLRPTVYCLLPTVCLTVLLPALILTKTTAIFLFPAIFYMVWARAGYRLKPALKLALPPAIGGLILWCAYFFLLVRPHYLEDYQYLFSANAYTGIALEPLWKVVLNTLTDGGWMGHVLYPAFYIVLALGLFWRPRLFHNPLVPALLLWIGGYTAFLAYHNNLQPRYYLVVAVPITAFVAIALETLRQPLSTVTTTPGAPPSRAFALGWVRRMPKSTIILNTLAAALVLAIAIPDITQQLDFIQHPTYDLLTAAREIATIVRSEASADHHPALILSISGSDITLMTGLPSIDDDFGTLDLAVRVKQYRPGWYVAWNEVDDDKADALTPLYYLQRVAAFPAMDDADRNLLILYRLNPRDQEEAEPKPHKRHTPKPLVTKLGQQPSVPQLQH